MAGRICRSGGHTVPGRTVDPIEENSEIIPWALRHRRRRPEKRKTICKAKENASMCMKKKRALQAEKLEEDLIQYRTVYKASIIWLRCSFLILVVRSLVLL